ncbi:MAG TPA: hypothetical protein VMU08_16400 [Rhizomicrobium sp.]|nr:hypothetical protein [Rhizomicrobium sp.]
MTLGRIVAAAFGIAAIALVVVLLMTPHPKEAPLPRAPSIADLMRPDNQILTPVHLTAAQDHARILKALHIGALRPGVSPDPKAPNAANYDEARANPYPELPDPLKLKNGQPVATPDTWWTQRRLEIADDFENEVYGRMLPVDANILWSVVDAAPERVGGIAATTRHLIGHVVGAGTRPPITLAIGLAVTLPAGAKVPVPIVLQLASGTMPPGPPSTWRAQVLAKGWGAAVLDVPDAQADDGAGLTGGVVGIAAKGQPRGLQDWGALRAWAWAASRAVDHFEEDSTVDATQIAIMGHSRFGKAALIAMAYDPRFAVAFISSSGVGGAALLRRNFGERLENLASVQEYHWMGSNFLKYAGPLTAKDLPVDAHELIALCAPRPVFIGAGSKGDEWVDPRGMFMAEVAAGPVYRLLGKKDLGATTMPPVGTALDSGELAFRQHAEGHTPEPNWPAFLAYASRYLHLRQKPG